MNVFVFKQDMVIKKGFNTKSDAVGGSVSDMYARSGCGATLAFDPVAHSPQDIAQAALIHCPVLFAVGPSLH